MAGQRQAFSGMRGIAPTPTYVVMQPTTLCNLDCAYCYLPFRADDRRMPVAVASAVAGAVNEWAGSPVTWPCFYGIDFATRAELLANGLEIDEIRRSIGADSLGYVSLDGLIAATEQPKTRLCRACFDGEYPIELPAGNLIGKHVLEGVDKRVVAESGSAGAPHDNEAGADRSAPGAHPLVASPGGGDALHRP